MTSELWNDLTGMERVKAILGPHADRAAKKRKPRIQRRPEESMHSLTIRRAEDELIRAGFYNRVGTGVTDDTDMNPVPFG